MISIHIEEISIPQRRRVVVELRQKGLEVVEIAAMLRISDRTATRDLAYMRDLENRIESEEKAASHNTDTCLAAPCEACDTSGLPARDLRPIWRNRAPLPAIRPAFSGPKTPAIYSGG